MKHILLLLFICPFFAISQNAFQSGYYVNNAGDTINCLIKNKDWKYNPEYLTIKSSSADQPKTIGIDSISFVEVGQLKFKKFTVKIDQSAQTTVNNLSKNSEPEFLEKTVFLKLISQGETNLYEHHDIHKINYFIENSEGVQPLVYKEFINNKNQIAKNETYKSQVLFLLNCDKLMAKDIQTLGYSRKELEQVFERYNNCSNDNYTYTKKTTRNGKLNISPKLSFNSSTITITSDRVNQINLDIESTHLTYGFEVEYILGFNNNKWSVFFNPFFERIEKELSNERFSDIDFNYKAIIARIGGKHFMFLNKDSKISIIAAINLSFVNEDSMLNYSESLTRMFSVDTGNYFNLGLGYTFKDKYTIEANYDLSKNLFQASNVETSFNNISISLMYNLL